MIRVIYISNGTNWMAPNELVELLEQSRVKNKEKDITGILLYGGGNFIQVLEGDEQKVHELYEVIKNDVRHKNCILIDESQITEKSFGEWSMGFQEISETDMKKVEGFNCFFENDNSPISQVPAVMETLIYFKNKMSII